MTGDEERLRGRGEIEDVVPEPEPGRAVRVGGVIVKETSAGGATVSFPWEAREAGGGRRHGTITCVLSKRGDEWRIESLHNAQAAEPSERDGAAPRETRVDRWAGRRRA